MPDSIDYAICQDHTSSTDPLNGPCGGEAPTRGRSRSGASTYIKCGNHWEEYEDRMNELDADLQRKFPGWNVPGSPPPSWFDPSYAGERWDDDY